MKNKKNNFLVLIILVTLFSALPLKAEVPHLINLQSMVYDADGNVTKSDKVSLTIRVLDETNNVIYTEDHKEVPVIEGAINVGI